MINILAAAFMVWLVGCFVIWRIRSKNKYITKETITLEYTPDPTPSRIQKPIYIINSSTFQPSYNSTSSSDDCFNYHSFDFSNHDHHNYDGSGWDMANWD